MMLLSHVTDVIKEDIGETRVYNSSGLFYTKNITNIEEVTSTKLKITVYLDETEANTDITDIKIYSKDGEEIASAAYNKSKNQYQTLLVLWYMEVK